jgi:hypothetical protein
MAPPHPDRHLVFEILTDTMLQNSSSFVGQYKQLLSAASLIHRKVGTTVPFTTFVNLRLQPHQFLNPDEAFDILSVHPHALLQTADDIKMCVPALAPSWMDRLTWKNVDTNSPLLVMDFLRNHPDVFTNMRERLATDLSHSKSSSAIYRMMTLVWIGIMNNNGNREDPDSTRIEYISAMDSVCTSVERSDIIDYEDIIFYTLCLLDDYDLKPCVDDVMALIYPRNRLARYFLARGMVTDMNEDQVWEFRDTALVLLLESRCALHNTDCSKLLGRVRKSVNFMDPVWDDIVHPDVRNINAWGHACTVNNLYSGGDHHEYEENDTVLIKL